MKRILTYFIGALALWLVGCDDFLDIVPKDKFIPSTVEDYENMLNDATCCASNDYFTEMRTDNVFIPEAPPSGLWTKQALPVRKIYKFEVNCYTENELDQMWSQAYKRVFYYNSVINDLPKIAGDGAHKKRVIAEALLFRAGEFLNLVNLYAQHYDAATAAQQPGIPIVTVADINSTHTRNSVQQVYSQIVGDVLEAIKSLPDKSVAPTKFRACKAAGYALLSRTYLYMGDYKNADKMANESLKAYSTLVDMNGYKVIMPGPFPGVPGAPLGWTDIPDCQYHPETLVARQFLRPFGLGMDVCASLDLAALFDDNDCRWTLYYANGWPPAPPFNYMNLYKTKIYLRGDFYNNFLSTPEQYLIRAECRARSNDLSGAIADINLLRSNRIKPEAYVAAKESDFANADEVLDFVLKERRRELAFMGLRHIDLKRLNREPRYRKTITHEIEGETYTLKPESANYLRQLWPGATKFNPNWILNPTK